MKRCKCECSGWCAVGRIVLGIGLVAALGAAVMLLWNWLMPDVIGWSAVNYSQALGLLVMGRLLLGGLKFGGCRCNCNCNCNCSGHHHAHRGRHFHEKWDAMSPEQRKEFMHKCQCGCGCDEDEDAGRE